MAGESCRWACGVSLVFFVASLGLGFLSCSGFLRFHAKYAEAAEHRLEDFGDWAAWVWLGGGPWGAKRLVFFAALGLGVGRFLLCFFMTGLK